jgi:hypothetical protein
VKTRAGGKKPQRSIAATTEGENGLEPIRKWWGDVAQLILRDRKGI